MTQSDVFTVETDSALAAIEAAIARLRSLTQTDMQTQWRWRWGDESVPDIGSLRVEDWQAWQVAPLNARRHVAWQKGQQVVWLCQQVTVPAHLSGYALAGLTLRCSLAWWAEEAQIYVDGQQVQAGDLFDYFTRIQLSAAVQPGDRFTLAVRLVSPGHDHGALVRSQLIYEVPTELNLPTPEPGFVADEIAVLSRYLKVLQPDQLETLAAAIAPINWTVVAQRLAFHQSLQQVRHQLQTQWQDWLKQRQIHYLGHAHLDMVWLWPLADTWDAAERTFKSVLALQADFPDLIFTHSSPALFAWLEAHRPALFAQIQQGVAAGTWEIAAGLWVEPELNLVSGESIGRQVLYGQRYVQEKFGSLSRIAWLPDSFGFCWQLPQILKQGGIDYFVTQKLRWNDATTFPHQVFRWQSPDGTQIFSLMAPPIGESMDPVKMADYASQWEQQTQSQSAFWLPGVGDHGGGPTRDMLQMGQRWRQSPLFPVLKPASALDYLQTLEQCFLSESSLSSLSESSQSVKETAKSSGTVKSLEIASEEIASETGKLANLPVWSDELYLEFHRGCYTSHADQKWWNRRCEDTLYAAELYAAIATVLTPYAYPQAALETAWKQVLFNQFHDILPGSAIPEVFIEANQAWQAAYQTGQDILQQALSAIADHIHLPKPPQSNAIPVLVFNPCSWARSQVVRLVLPAMPASQENWAWRVVNHQGQPLVTQAAVQDVEVVFPVNLSGQMPEVEAANLSAANSGSANPISANSGPGKPNSANALLVMTPAVPPVGYRLLWLVPDGARSHQSQPLRADGYRLENQYLRVEVNPQTGDLDRVYDKVNQREVLSGAGNQLQGFHDRGQYWDAWNIDPQYADQPLPPSQLVSLEWLEQGMVRSRLRVVRRIGQSDFCQDYVLDGNAPFLRIESTVNWQERHVLVKAAFPLTVKAEMATYEMPYGAIARSTQPQTAAEKAKWEVPALRWADLSQGGYGVSLLNDCKYGYDSQPHQLRLTLLRGSEWPDPNADLGIHRFTYALYPHADSWQAARTVHHGYELNRPLRLWLGEPMSHLDKDHEDSDQLDLGAIASFLDPQSSNWILSALKLAEDDPERLILRGYECHGAAATLAFQGDLALTTLQPVNGLEIPTDAAFPVAQTVTVSPWQIRSFLAQVKPRQP